MAEFTCPACEGGFDDPVPKHNDDAYDNPNNHPTSYHCPHCGHTMSVEFTRRQNMERCACSATVDSADGTETCSSCGRKRGLHGEVGIKEAWATPSADDVERLDEYQPN